MCSLCQAIEKPIYPETNLNQWRNFKKLSNLEVEVQSTKNKLNKERIRYRINFILHGKDHAIQFTWN
jgi:hypothetical protein